MSRLPNAIKDLGDIVQKAIGDITGTVNSLQEAARADDKTPLLNGLALSAAGTRVGSKDGPDIIVFGDLNRFKAINDAHGHAVGDAAINQVGQMVHTMLVLGCQGEGYRRSGDEFVVLLQRQSLENFQKTAQSFAHCAFHVNGQAHSVSMSFGYAVADGSADWYELVKRAEDACQVAKNTGDGHYIEWTAELQKNIPASRRFRCSCGVRFSCELKADALPPLVACPCCRKEHTVPGASAPKSATEATVASESAAPSTPTN